MSSFFSAAVCELAVTIVLFGPSVLGFFPKLAAKIRNCLTDSTWVMPVPAGHKCWSCDCCVDVTNTSASSFVLAWIQVYDSAGRTTRLTMWTLRLMPFICGMYSLPVGNEGSFCGRVDGFISMGTVPPSQSSINRERGRIASTCLSQKSHPSMIDVDSLSAT